MATLFLTEFVRQGRDGAGYLLQGGAGENPAVANQVLAIGAGSVQSATLNAGTTLVRIHADSTCSVEISTNPTATATTRRIAANMTQYEAVPANSGFRVAVIANT